MLNLMVLIIMIIAHVFLGILLAVALSKISFFNKYIQYLDFEIPFVKTFTKEFILVSIFAFGSILPDLDIPFIEIIGWNIEHRQLLTHSAVPYLTLVIIFFCIFVLQEFLLTDTKKSKIIKGLTLSLFFVSSISLFHVVTDIFTAPSLLFAPIYIKTIYYPIFPFETYPNWFYNYVNSPNIIIELLPLVLTLIFLPKTLKRGRELMYMLFFLGILLTSIFLTLIPFI